MYPVPAGLVDDLVCKQFLPRDYLGEVAVGVITCIWEGRQIPTTMSAADISGLQEFILARSMASCNQCTPYGQEADSLR